MFLQVWRQVGAAAQGEVGDAPTGVARQPQGLRVVPVQHAETTPGDGLGDHRLHRPQIVEGVDALDAQMVVRDVQHATDVAPVEAQAGAEDSSAGRLQDRRLDRGVRQHHAGADWTAGVAFVDPFAVDVDAGGAGEADGQAPAMEDVGHHPHRGRLAVGARHRGDGNARRSPLGEKHVDDRGGDVPRPSLGRLQMHAESGRGVDFHNAAAGLDDRLGDVGGQEVDPGDVKADDAGGPAGDQGIGRMDDVGAIDGPPAGRKIGGGAQHHGLAVRRDACGGEAGARQALLNMVVDDDAGHDRLVTRTPPRVLIHRLDELFDGALSIAGHARGNTFGNGDHLPAHHQDPIVATLELLFDDDAAAVLDRLFEAPAHRLGRGQVEAHAAPVIAIQRLGDDRSAELRRSGHGFVRGADQGALGNGDPGGGQ